MASKAILWHYYLRESSTVTFKSGHSLDQVVEKNKKEKKNDTITSLVKDLSWSLITSYSILMEGSPETHLV